MALVQEARKLKPTGTVRSYAMAMLIALVYLTGLRIGEALRLTIKDFRSDPYRLFIAKSKFGKDRWVLLKDSVALKLQAYLEVRRRFVEQTPDSPIFLNKYGRALSYRSPHALSEGCLINVRSDGLHRSSS